jgi:hypothetical protein
MLRSVSTKMIDSYAYDSPFINNHLEFKSCIPEFELREPRPEIKVPLPVSGINKIIKIKPPASTHESRIQICKSESKSPKEIKIKTPKSQYHPISNLVLLICSYT